MMDTFQPCPVYAVPGQGTEDEPDTFLKPHASAVSGYTVPLMPLGVLVGPGGGSGAEKSLCTEDYAYTSPKETSGMAFCRFNLEEDWVDINPTHINGFELYTVDVPGADRIYSCLGSLEEVEEPSVYAEPKAEPPREPLELYAEPKAEPLELYAEPKAEPLELYAEPKAEPSREHRPDSRTMFGFADEGDLQPPITDVYAVPLKKVPRRSQVPDDPAALYALPKKGASRYRSSDASGQQPTSASMEESTVRPDGDDSNIYGTVWDVEA